MSDKPKFIGYLATDEHRRALNKLRKAVNLSLQPGQEIATVSPLVRYAVWCLASEYNVELPPARPPAGGPRPGSGRPKK